MNLFPEFIKAIPSTNTSTKVLAFFNLNDT